MKAEQTPMLQHVLNSYRTNDVCRFLVRCLLLAFTFAGGCSHMQFAAWLRRIQ